MFISFLQYSFILGVILSAAVLISIATFAVIYCKKSKSANKKSAVLKFVAAALVVASAMPSVLAMSKYKLSNSKIETFEEFYENMFNKTDKELAVKKAEQYSQIPDTLEESVEFLIVFKEENFRKLSAQEKLNHLRY